MTNIIPPMRKGEFELLWAGMTNVNGVWQVFEKMYEYTPCEYCAILWRDYYGEKKCIGNGAIAKQ